MDVEWAYAIYWGRHIILIEANGSSNLSQQLANFMAGVTPLIKWRLEP